MDNAKSDKSLLYITAGFLSFLTGSKIYELLTRENRIEQQQLAEKKEEEEPVLSIRKPRRGTFTMHKNQQVYRIVVTGGPCAGKTTAIAHIANRFRERGLKVLTSPCAASLAFVAGVGTDNSKRTSDENLRFHRNLLNYYCNIEERFMEFASLSTVPTVILCDRGTMEIQAHMDPDTWQGLLDEVGLNAVQLRDKRYDGIIHMVTAADGAVDYYDKSNRGRDEISLQNAIELDRKLQQAWSGHPQFLLVSNNYANFQKKVDAAYQAAARILGIQTEEPKVYYKYLLKKSKAEDIYPELPQDLEVQLFQINDTFLQSKEDNVENKIRRRGQEGAYFYQYYTTTYERAINYDKDWKNDGVELKKQISAREYLGYYEIRDRQKITLKKVRRSFFWKGKFFFIDTFLNVKDGFCLLYINKDLDYKTVDLPKTLFIEKDVTQDKEYSSNFLARKENETPIPEFLKPSVDIN